MGTRTLREALIWTLPLGMTFMLAGTIGLLVYQLVAETSMPDLANIALSWGITLLVWAWSMRLVVLRRNV